MGYRETLCEWSLNAMKSGVQQVRAVEFYEDFIMSECDEERSATL